MMFRTRRRTSAPDEEVNNYWASHCHGEGEGQRRRNNRCCSSPWSPMAAVAACFILLVSVACKVGVVMGFRPATATANRPFPATSGGVHARGREGLLVVSQPSLQTTNPTTAFGSSGTSLNMFMGSDGGILGIGGPELVSSLCSTSGLFAVGSAALEAYDKLLPWLVLPGVSSFEDDQQTDFPSFILFRISSMKTKGLILLVGYFVLGPSDLYKLTKEIGKFIQNARTFSTDLTTTFESNMESQLQIEELRKAQRELNDAFNFRRSINVDEDSEAFSTNVQSPREGLREGVEPSTLEAADEAAAAAAATAAAAPGKKKKIRRRVKKRVAAEEETVPDLEMPAPPSPVEAESDEQQQRAEEDSYSKEELDLINKEFDQYVGTPEEEEPPSWVSGPPSAVSAPPGEQDAAADAAAQTRFQQQMSGNWNDQILSNEDKLEPLAQVMQKIALLEEEKVAATKRLEEEYAKRAELEETYYRKQRQLLEEAATQVQADAFVGGDFNNKP